MDIDSPRAHNVLAEVQELYCSLLHPTKDQSAFQQSSGIRSSPQAQRAANRQTRSRERSSQLWES